MSSDRSRRTDPTRFGYTGVVAQQGRVVLDRDFNAQQGLTADRIDLETIDVIGPCGTPDDGFRISLPGQSPPAPPFWSPPQGVNSPPESPGAAGDFFIQPGTMYVGGQRVCFPPLQNGKPTTYSYYDQPDWAVPAFPVAARYELVWLEVLETEVGAIEDPDLLEVALGGPDTTQRLKLLSRVMRGPVTDPTCTIAWAEAVAVWKLQGWTFNPLAMQLMPDVTVKVTFANPGGSGDLCDPVATGGYLGADNQLIRLRTAHVGSVAFAVWSWDNASFLYRVTSVSPDGTTLTLGSNPPDGYHVPQTGQVIEVLATAAMLEEEPDETSTTGGQILRAVAEPIGWLSLLAQPYGPLTSGDTSSAIVLAQPLPAAYAGYKLPLFLRVWQSATEIPASGSVTLSDPVSGQSTGVTANFSVPVVADSVFWQVAVRPATPQGVYPEDLLIAPQPPDGPRRWVCPLAVIDWELRKVTECRSVFNNLVALSKRKPGCCTVSVAPSDIGAALTLQAVIDAAVLQAQTVTVCLGAGSYNLLTPLLLGPQHAGLTLESCGGAATIQADPKADSTLFRAGLIVVDAVDGITLTGLALLPTQALQDAKETAAVMAMMSAAQTGASSAVPSPTLSFGVRAVNATDLTLQHCSVTFNFDRSNATNDLVAAALFLQGDCAGLSVRGCSFVSDVAPTYNPLAVTTANAAPPTFTRFTDSMTRMLQVAAPVAAPATSPPASAPPTTGPATASPPSTPRVLEMMVSNSVDLLVAKRLAVNTTTPSRAVASVGVLAADYTGTATNGAVVDCLLGTASIRDTQFAGLTFATAMQAGFADLRLQDNDVSGVVSGFWIQRSDAVAPIEVAEGTNSFLPQSFEESLLLASFAPTAALPAAPLASPATARTDMAVRIVTTGYGLTVSGNQISTVTGAANAALYLLMNSDSTTGSAAPELNSSVIVTGNRLWSSAGASTPVALITLSYAQPCTVTGNTVLNATGGTDIASAGPSLWLIVGTSLKGAPAIAVTGNMLRGRTDLDQLSRPGMAAPLQTWSVFNAIQA